MFMRKCDDAAEVCRRSAKPDICQFNISLLMSIDEIARDPDCQHFLNHPVIYTQYLLRFFFFFCFAFVFRFLTFFFVWNFRNDVRGVRDVRDVRGVRDVCDVRDVRDVLVSVVSVMSVISVMSWCP